MSASGYSLTPFLEDYRDSPEIMGEILNLYVTEAPERIAWIESGLADGECERVARAAHSLANTGGTLKSDSVVCSARELEAAARAGDAAACVREARRLIEMVREVLAQVEAFMNSL